MQFSRGKIILKNKFENRFSKSKTGFRFSNRKPDFRFSINIPTSIDNQTNLLYTIFKHLFIRHYYVTIKHKLTALSNSEWRTFQGPLFWVWKPKSGYRFWKPVFEFIF